MTYAKMKDRVFITVYTPKGIIVSQGQMFKGKKDGLWREYNDVGTMMRSEEYKDGKKNGASITYSGNGMVMEEPAGK